MIQNRIQLLETNLIVIQDRQRTEIDQTELQDLSQSISKYSLIHPVLIELDTHNLIAGERRLRAFQLAAANHLPCPEKGYENWTKIPVRFVHNVTDAEVFEIELIENIDRSQLSWPDEAKAIAKLHQNHLLEDSTWTQLDTAKLIHKSQSYVSNSIAVANALSSSASDEKFRQMLLDSAGIKAAYKLLERKKSRSSESILDIAFGRRKEPDYSDSNKPDVSNSKQPQDKPIQTKQAQADPAQVDPSKNLAPQTSVAKSESSLQLLCADFNSWARTYSGPPFNFLHLDFPYGIDLCTSPGMGTAKDFNSYDDSTDVLRKLLDTLFSEKERLIAPSAHIMFWFSQNHRRELEYFFEEDLEAVVKDHLMIWNCSDNSGIVPEPEYYGRRNYETAMLIVFEKRKIVKPVSLCYSHPRNYPERIHRSEKPLKVLQHFFQMFVDESTIFGDFTCGSGTSLHAARKLGAKSIVGLEKDQEIFKLAEQALEFPHRFFGEIIKETIE